MTKKYEKVVICAHVFLYGAAHALRDYLNEKKTPEIIFIGLPFHEQKYELIEKYKNGKITYKNRKLRKSKINLYNYLLDFIVVLRSIFKEKRKTSLFIGTDPLLTLGGIFLKKINKVDKVILYSIDFVPRRFSGLALNKIYHFIEKYCVLNADEVWNVSPRIAKGREEFLGISSKKVHHKVVPIGVWNKNVRKLPFEKIKKTQAVFLGHLLEKQGLQLVIEAVPIIVKKIPDFKLVVIGGGEFGTVLKDKARKLNLSKFIEFKGWVKDKSRINLILAQSALSLATYKPEGKDTDNFTYYADPTKIKDYLSAGLPIIMTDIFHSAKELKERKCGIVVSYDSKAISNAIINLLSDVNRLKLYRRNCLSYSQEFEWTNIFDNTLP